MGHTINRFAPILYAGGFFDLPVWQQIVLSLFAGVFGLPICLLAYGDSGDSMPKWARVATVLVGVCVTGGLLAMFMLSHEVQWGGYPG